MLSFVISNTDKHEFVSIWKWIRCCNDVMNDVDCVIKRDVYQQNVHSRSKNIRGISVFILNILKYPLYIKNNISWVILHGYSRSWKINSPSERWLRVMKKLVCHSLTLYHTITTIQDPDGKSTFENIVRKAKIAGNQHEKINVLSNIY